MKKSDRVTAFMAELGITSSASNQDPRYLGFFHCFNRGEYYEAHDVLEDLWLETHGHDREFYKGLIQVAGAFVHLRKQAERPHHHHHGRRLVPAARIFRLAIARLAPFAPHHLGADISAILHLCQSHLIHIEASDHRLNPWHNQRLPKIAHQGEAISDR